MSNPKAYIGALNVLETAIGETGKLNFLSRSFQAKRAAARPSASKGTTDHHRCQPLAAERVTNRSGDSRSTSRQIEKIEPRRITKKQSGSNGHSALFPSKSRRVASTDRTLFG